MSERSIPDLAADVARWIRGDADDPRDALDELVARLETAEAEDAAVRKHLREFNHVEGEPTSEIAAVAESTFGFLRHAVEAAGAENVRLQEGLRRLRDHHERSWDGNHHEHPVGTPCRVVHDTKQLLSEDKGLALTQTQAQIPNTEIPESAFVHTFRRAEAAEAQVAALTQKVEDAETDAANARSSRDELVEAAEAALASCQQTLTKALTNSEQIEVTLAEARQALDTLSRWGTLERHTYGDFQTFARSILAATGGGTGQEQQP